MLRKPALHFVLLGGALFGLHATVAGGAAEPRALVVPAEQVQHLAEAAGRELRRPPSRAELRARIRGWVDEELLLAEARRRGWHRSDPVVQQRLVRNLRFLGVAPEADAAALARHAFALELDRSDLVVRRRLLTRARLAIASEARREPGDAELAALLRASPRRFAAPARVRVGQVFLSRDRRGARLARDAEQLLTALRADDPSPAEAARRGDPSLLPTELPLASAADLDARFGAGFGPAVLSLAPGGWQGPVPSSYGLHLVRIHERRPARPLRLAEARPAVRAAWLAEREREALHAALEALRRDVDLRVEGFRIEGLQSEGFRSEGDAWTPRTSASKSATASR